MIVVEEWGIVARTLAELVRHYRGARGLTQTQLGELIGRTQGYISEIEKGKNKEPSREVLKELFLILKPPPGEFLMALLDIEGIYEPELPPLPEGQVENIVIATHTIEGIQRMDEPEHVKRMMKEDFLRTWRRSEEERKRLGH